MNAPGSTPKGKRRTQIERRTETIGLLVAATQACLVELGYTRTTTQAIAERAGLSQGAIFRHFASRTELLVATADCLADRSLVNYETNLSAHRHQGCDEIESALRALYEVTSSPAQIAWFELLLAARTDALLRDAMRPIFLRNQEDTVKVARQLFPSLLSQLPMSAEVVSVLIQIFHGMTVAAHMEQDPERKARLLAATTLLAKNSIAQFHKQDVMLAAP